MDVLVVVSVIIVISLMFPGILLGLIRTEPLVDVNI